MITTPDVFDILKKGDRVMKAWTGISVAEFKEMIRDFEGALNQQKQLDYEEGLKKGERQRKPGGGSTGKLKTVEEKLFFILTYLKCYITFDVFGSMFDLSGSNACRNVHKLLPILEKSLEDAVVLPKRKLSSLDELFEFFPEVKDFFIDVTERPIQRPTDNDEQKNNYSGKKKRHTNKNTVITNEDKEVLYIGPTVEGKKHDYGTFKEEFPPDVTPSEGLSGEGFPQDGPRIWVDLGYTGILKDYPEFNILIPWKKPKGGELTGEEKTINKGISSIRILVENAIAGIKRFKIVTDIFRNRVDGFANKVMAVACGLWNYHVVYG